MSSVQYKSCIFVVWLLLAFASNALIAQDFKLGYTAPASSTNPTYRNVILEIEGVDRTNASSPIPKGMLIPRMTTAERDQIATAPQGLLLYLTDNITGFYYNNASSGSPTWERLLTGNNNSLNGIFTITDSIFRFSNSNSSVKINTLQNNALELGKNGISYMRIPSTIGNTATSSGMVIADNEDFLVSSGALLTLNSSNKGLMLPRVTSLSAISLPPFGLIVILSDPTNTSTKGVYIQMGDNPFSPSWQRITTAAVP